MCARLVEVSGAHARLVAVRPRNPRRLLARYSAMHLTRPVVHSSPAPAPKLLTIDRPCYITTTTSPV